MLDQVMQRPLSDAFLLVLPVGALLLLIAIVFGAWRRRSQRATARRTAYQIIIDPANGTGTASPGQAHPPWLDQMEQQVEADQRDGRQDRIAALYLEIAIAKQRDGDLIGAMTAFRSAAGTAARYGPPVVHARARLALAEGAVAAGDMTEACEQMQMARDAFRLAGLPDEAANVEARMRSNGCPTDWVLTDF